MAVQNNKAEGTVLLEMKHVKKSFDKSGVLKDISLKVREGQVVSIIGPVSYTHLDVYKRQL